MASINDNQLTIKANNPGCLQGHNNVSVSCLLKVMEPGLALELATRIENIYSGMDGSNVMNVVAVLKFWGGLSEKEPNLYLFTLEPDVPPVVHEQVLSNVRDAWYQRGMTDGQSGPSLPFLNRQWTAFIRCLKRLADGKLVPRIDYDSATVKAVPSISRARVLADTAKTLNEAIADDLGPVVMDFAPQLLEPIPLVLTDEAFLDAYARSLRFGIDQFMACAMRDLDFFQQLEEKGKRLVGAVDYEAMKRRFQSESCHWRKYKDADGRHFFKTEHPDCLANNLAVVVHEMGGIPRRHQTCSQNGGRAVTVGPSHWVWPQRLGLYGLLPYLGLLTMHSLVPLLVIIWLENPKINVESLINADLEDRDGNVVLLATAGDGDEVRMYVNKPRAKSQKTSILPDRSREALAAILRWTARYREILLRQGHPDARKLLLVMTQDYKIRRVVKWDVQNAFQGTEGNNSKKTCFLARHPELAPWRERATPAALRVSAGVMRWLASDGDLEQARRAFGHKDIVTTLSRYLPPQVLEVMHERMIRRGQQFLILAATAGKDYMLEATDFNTMEDVHLFLKGLVVETAWSGNNPLMRRAWQIIEGEQQASDEMAASTPTDATEAGLEVIWNLSVDNLAILRLYRENLLGQSLPEWVLRTTDGGTGTSPGFWIELGNIVVALDQEGLPPEHAEHETVFARSLARANELRDKVMFPVLAVREEN